MKKQRKSGLGEILVLGASALFLAVMAHLCVTTTEPPTGERNILTGDAVITQKALFCVTEALYDQMLSAVTREDAGAFDYLMTHGCGALTPNLNATVLDSNLFGPSHLRVYTAGGETVEVWVDAELGLRVVSP